MMDKKQLDEIRARAEAAAIEIFTVGISNQSCLDLYRQDIPDLLKYIELLQAGDGLSDALLQANLTTMKAQNRILGAQKKQIEKLQKYVGRLEEIEQIYKRGNENYEKRIRELLEQIDDAPIGYGYEE